MYVCMYYLCAVLLHIQADGEEYVYRVSASGVDGSTFSAHIRVPG